MSVSEGMMNFVRGTTDWQQGISDAFNGTTDNGFDNAVDKWLESVISAPSVHWFSIITSAMMTGGRKKGEGILQQTSGGLTELGVITAGDLIGKLAQGGDNAFLQTYGELQQRMQDPNIEGIAIGSPKVTCSREVQLSEHMVIVQSKENGAYRNDNATPKPRKWNVEGYLRQTSSFDQLFVIKPSLFIQVRMLDAYAVSRKPLWFKDDYNTFYKVQIASFNNEHDATSTNTVKISMTLQEYNPYIVQNLQGNIEYLIKEEE